MKQYKKRTLALVLASVITVVGAFGTDLYKNSLMSLGFKNNQNDSVGMVIYTKNGFSHSINPIRRDVNTYEILLPETDSQLSSDLPMGRNVQNIDIKTLPYSSGGIGYTKITVTTQDNIPLYLETAVAAPKDNVETGNNNSNENDEYRLKQQRERQQDMETMQNMNRPAPTRPTASSQNNDVDIKESIKQFQPSEEKVEIPKEEKVENTKHQFEMTKFILGGILLIFIIIFLFLRTRERMSEITGEQGNLDLDEVPEKKTEKKTKINNTIKTLDKKYQNNNYTQSKITNTNNNNYNTEYNESPVDNNDEDIEVQNIVDLDELMQQGQNKVENTENQNENPVIELESEENNNLDDFLSTYSFDDIEEETEEAPEEIQEEETIDEELYDKYINNENNFKFSKDDTENINLLISNEISDETMNNLDQFVILEEKEKIVTPKENLENFITSFSLSQNITFTSEDINAIKKIMSVELDDDFVTDLKTNPTKIEKLQQEYQKQTSNPHRTSEVITLNVKDLLPDLSEEMKKQGGKKIESDAKPQVVYYSEGYDVNKLKINNDILPDLTKEINNENAYTTRPSDDIDLVDNSYEVEKMSMDELPDLEDMLKHPEKYEKPKPKPEIVNEDTLLNNILNVSFKPFDDGTRKFEILNDIKNAPTVSEMQKEFKELNGNFEIVEEEDIPDVEDTEKNDFETLYDGDYVNLDSPEDIEESCAKNIEKLKKVKNSKKTITDKDNDILEKTEAQKLLEQIKLTEENRKNKSKIEQLSANEEEKNEEELSAIAVESPEFCILDNEKYTIVSTNKFTNQIGCYLAKNDNGYCVIGFVGDKVYKIKTYELLNNENMQSRMSKKIDDNTARYIVRIGIHKFIINVDKEKMEFVMDLC